MCSQMLVFLGKSPALSARFLLQESDLPERLHFQMELGASLATAGCVLIPLTALMVLQPLLRINRLNKILLVKVLILEGDQLIDCENVPQFSK